jgi:hypothetical protein
MEALFQYALHMRRWTQWYLVLVGYVAGPEEIRPDQKESQGGCAYQNDVFFVDYHPEYYPEYVDRLTTIDYE